MYGPKVTALGSSAPNVRINPISVGLTDYKVILVRALALHNNALTDQCMNPSSMKIATVGHVPVSIRGAFCKMISLTNEGYDFVSDPERILEDINSSLRADIFTFTQKIPETLPRFSYHLE